MSTTIEAFQLLLQILCSSVFYWEFSESFQMHILNKNIFSFIHSFRAAFNEKAIEWGLQNKFIRSMIDSRESSMCCELIFGKNSFLSFTLERSRQIDVFLFSSMTQTPCHREMLEKRWKIFSKIPARQGFSPAPRCCFFHSLFGSRSEWEANGMLILIFIDYSTLPPTLAGGVSEHGIWIDAWVLQFHSEQHHRVDE